MDQKDSRFIVKGLMLMVIFRSMVPERSYMFMGNGAIQWTEFRPCRCLIGAGLLSKKSGISGISFWNNSHYQRLSSKTKTKIKHGSTLEKLQLFVAETFSV